MKKISYDKHIMFVTTDFFHDLTALISIFLRNNKL